MCHTIGCSCFGRLHSALVGPSNGRFSVLAPVYSRDAVGSFIDRFQGLWPHPTSHDWPAPLHFPLDTSLRDAPSDRRRPEPHPDIKSILAQNIAPLNLPAFFHTFPSTTMEFSGKDLEDIQRVAGLLNLTVDELLQQSRDRIHHATPVRSPRQLSPQYCISQTESSLSLDIRPAQRQSAPGFNLDPFDFDVPQSESPATDPVGSSPPLPARHPGTQVILLNPQSPWYDCDAALLDFNESFSDSLELDRSNYPDTDTASSFVPVEAMQTDSRSASENTAREKGIMSPMDDGSTDWALVSPPESLALQTPASPSTGSTDKRYYMIAPRSSKSSAQSNSESSSYRVKKKRRPYEGTKKTDTHLTRQVHACVRCRMQRNRVRWNNLVPNPFSCRLADHHSVHSRPGEP